MCQRGAAAQLFSQKKHKIGYRFMSSQQVCQHGLGRGSLMLIIQENTLFYPAIMEVENGLLGD